MKAVIVTWDDAHDLTETWTARPDLDSGPFIVTSIGFLLEDVKPEYVVIAQSFVEDDVDNALAIPVGMVRSLRVIA